MTPLQAETDHSNRPGPLEGTVRRVARWIWIFVGVLEALLLLRILTMIAIGENEDGSARVAVFTPLFRVTQLFVGPFQPATMVSVLNSTHAFDVAALLAMDAYFFAWLAGSKLAIWAGREIDARRRTSEREPVVEHRHVDEPMEAPTPAASESAEPRSGSLLRRL